MINRHFLKDSCNSRQLFRWYNYISFTKRDLLYFKNVKLQTQTSINSQLPHWLPGFPVHEAPVFVWPACPGSCSLLSILSALCGSPEPLYVHTSRKERPAVTSRDDDHSNADPGQPHWQHTREMLTSLRCTFSRGLPAQTWLRSNQECDQVNLCADLITHSKHIMGGKPGKRYILWGTLAFRGVFCYAIFLLNGFMI